MKTIKILMLHLGYGGVEKQTITMANKLANYYNIEIISFYRLNKEPSYEIDKKIKIKYLCLDKPNKEEIRNAIKKINILKLFKEGLKAIKILYRKQSLIKKEIQLNDADIYFSTRTEFGILLSKYGSKNAIKLTQEHNFFDDKKYKKRITKGYKKLDYVIVISKYHEKMYKEWFKNSKIRIKRIENILEHESKKFSKLNNNAIIAAGRLNYIKDFDSLINIMNYAVKGNKNLKLYLLGDGEEKENLKKKIKELNLEKNIIMTGFVNSNDVKKYMLKSDLYIMTSIRECFPMVLLEANNCGLSVVSYDILTGPHEIVQNKKTGYLIKNRNEIEMAEKINELIKDKKLLKEFSKNAVEYSKNFKSDIIIEKWIKIFEEER